MIEKICTKCRISKPLDCFYKQKTSSDGHGSWCKECNKANVRRWKAENPERFPGYQRKSKYGLSAEDYERMLSEQEDRCAICSQQGKLVVDHDHETGRVRGLLCNGCNVRLAKGPWAFLVIDKTAEATSYLSVMRQHPDELGCGAPLPSSDA